jgi:hypothetical protein
MGLFFCCLYSYNSIPMSRNTVKKQLPKDRKARTPVPPQLRAYLFKKDDPRINRKGRPKDFDALRELAREILSQAVLVPVGKGKNKQEIVLTRVETILMDWVMGTNFQKQLAVIQYAYGKVPDKVDVSGTLSSWSAFIKRNDDPDKDPDPKV